MRKLLSSLLLTSALVVVINGAAPAQGFGYGKPVRDSFMRECITSETGSYTTCQCMLLQFEEQIPLQVFTKMRKTVQAGGEANPNVLKRYERIVMQCFEREKD